MSYPITLPLNAASPLATLTHPSKEIWEIEMHNGPDNRLTAVFVTHVLMKALDLVEKDWRSTPSAPGALVITGKKDQAKFFSNGLSIFLSLGFMWSAERWWEPRPRLRELFQGSRILRK